MFSRDARTICSGHPLRLWMTDISTTSGTLRDRIHLGVGSLQGSNRCKSYSGGASSFNGEHRDCYRQPGLIDKSCTNDDVSNHTWRPCGEHLISWLRSSATYNKLRITGVPFATAVRYISLCIARIWSRMLLQWMTWVISACS